MNHDKRLWKRVTFLLVAIAGFGSPALAQSVSLSTASLGFGNVVVGTTSARKTVTLTNTGSASLLISSITASGDFAQTNTCGSSVAAGGKCAIRVTFTPTTPGDRAGTLTIADNASNSPQAVQLSGTGVLPVTLSPTSLSFSAQPVGTTSAAQTVTLTNNQRTTLTISGIAISGDFAQTNTCGGSVGAVATCTISVTFRPTPIGSRTGTLTVTDNASNSPQAVSLSASGTGSAPNLVSIAVAPANHSIPKGTTQQFTATGSYTDGSTQNLTGSVSWSSSAAGVATISNTVGGQGLASSVGTGSTTISATSGSVTGSTTLTVTAAPLRQFGHIVVVLEENTNFADVTSSAMPYLFGLMQKYGLAAQYYADTHPSIGNYFMLTTGQILTNDGTQTPSSFPVSADNVVRELVTAGKTWKSYAEDLPSVGWTGGDLGNYAVRHNPFPYFTDVQNSATQRQNLVPFTQFATDLASNALPQYSFVVPNLCDDAHDCSLSVADNWLKTNIDPFLQSNTWKQDGLLIVVFDESGSDNANGGGRIVCMLASPFSKPSYQSTTLYQHESLLRLTLEGLGVTTLPGAAATAPAMWEFFSSLAISTASLPGATVGVAYSTSLTATGGTIPYTWTASDLPTGLSISSGGTISGTPTVAGTFNVA